MQLPLAWALANLIALLSAVYLTLSAMKIDPPMKTWLFMIATVVAILSAPLQEDLKRGQVYLFILFLYAVTFWAMLNKHDRVAGIALAMLALSKISGWPVWIVLIAVQRWRVIKWAAAGVITGVVVSVSLVGLDVWRVYVTQVVAANVFNPAAAITAYQTVGGFFQHLFRYDPQLNPAPLIDLPWLAAVGSIGITIGLLGITWFRSRRISIASALGAAMALSVILSPLAEQYHFLILIVPLIVIAVGWPMETWLRRGLFIAAIGLLAVALPYKSPKVSSGLFSLLAYPRLYGALIIWILLCWKSPAVQPELIHE